MLAHPLESQLATWRTRSGIKVPSSYPEEAGTELVPLPAPPKLALTIHTTVFPQPQSHRWLEQSQASVSSASPWKKPDTSETTEPGGGSGL